MKNLTGLIINVILVCILAAIMTACRFSSMPESDVYEFALDATRNGDTLKGLKIYRKIIDRNPDFAPAFYGMDCVSMGMKNYDLAIDCFNEAIRANPKHARAFNNLAIPKLNKLVSEANTSADTPKLDFSLNSKSNQLIKRSESADKFILNISDIMLNVNKEDFTAAH